MGSIFSKHKTTADRSASDKRRHKEKIDKAIRDGIHDIVAEESIIGQNGKKKIRIPVKGIKEYKFVYGDNNKQKAGSGGDKDIKRGQKISKGNKPKKGKSEEGKPGNKSGEEYYEVEVTLEELANYLFKDLKLPEMEQKKLKEIVSEKTKRKGYRPQGIRPRLSKKESTKQRIKRKKAAQRTGNIKINPDTGEEEFGFIEQDLRYKHIKTTLKQTTNACIFFIMDISGSMTKEKKYLARSFFFLLYQFIKSKYEKTELVFVAHDTKPYEVDEDKFFNRGTGGGTMVSPTIEYVLEQIEKRYNPDSWNIYNFHCSDGDNFPEDMKKTIEANKKLKNISQFYGYCEIVPKNGSSYSFGSLLSKEYKSLKDDKFKVGHITKKEDVWKVFQEFFKEN